MPKGDRFKLKADPEDGTTPIANLLLEAVAMSKLSGLQKGAILYLWRRTYGWVGKNGSRLKERKIPLREWVYRLNSTKGRISLALKDLCDKSIFERHSADPWGGYFYSLNTDISKWNSNCINLARLSEMVTVTDFGTVTEIGNSYHKKNGTVTENGTELLPKTVTPLATKSGVINKDKERLNKERNINIDLENTFFSGQSIAKILRILRKETREYEGVLPANLILYRKEVKRLGIKV